ncbi:MAG: hypothetical protein H6744_15480 [Deltaproteobacteria bacterium]|nr:hypothetical protein [Deltaproteobacteria bacterium]MCB9788083.1 hypothetical protein [Deltaproteobacteria bacterium]
MSEDAADGGEVDVASALAALDASALAGVELIINADGSVTFVDFPPEFLEVAFALNPDDPLVCERKDLLADAQEP